MPSGAGDPEVDPRTERPGICGITRQVGHTEWICIALAHDTEHQRSTQRYGFGYFPKAERHYFVRRWPNSDR